MAYTTLEDSYLQQIQAMQQAQMSSGGYLVPGSYTGGGTLTSASSGTLVSYPMHQTPWTHADEWDSKDNQEAARYGWMLVSGDNDTPKLVAWAQGAKAEKSDEDIFTDCLEHSLTGSCEIAFKILQVLTKNRSPYSEYEDSVKAMSENYGVDNG